MFFFTLKKWFFDLWDNLFAAFLINAVFAFCLAIPLVLPPLVVGADSPTYALYLVMIPGLLLLSVVSAVASRFAWDMAKGERLELSRFVTYLKAAWLPGLVLGLVNVVLIFLALNALTFYGSQDDFMSTVGMGVVFWLVLFWMILSQFWYPLNAQIENRIPKLFRKCFILFVDNPGLSFGMLITSALIVALSVVTLSLFPGITGLLLWHQVSLKLRMYKYDWLEAHPEADRRRIPWGELLAEEKEKIGKRTLRNMVFPWKD